MKAVQCNEPLFSKQQFKKLHGPNMLTIRWLGWSAAVWEEHEGKLLDSLYDIIIEEESVTRY